MSLVNEPNPINPVSLYIQKQTSFIPRAGHASLHYFSPGPLFCLYHYLFFSSSIAGHLYLTDRWFNFSWWWTGFKHCCPCLTPTMSPESVYSSKHMCLACYLLRMLISCPAEGHCTKAVLSASYALDSSSWLTPSSILYTSFPFLFMSFLCRCPNSAVTHMWCILAYCFCLPH